MTTENTIQKRIRRSPEERLQAMLEQQANLAAQLKAQQKKVAERAAKARADKIAELGELALSMLGPVNVEVLREILLASGAVLQPAPADDVPADIPQDLGSTGQEGASADMTDQELADDAAALAGEKDLDQLI